MPIPALHVSEDLHRHTGFLMSNSRRLLRCASTVLLGGGSSVLAQGQLIRCFDEDERNDRAMKFDEIQRGRWSPETRKSRDGIEFVSCEVTTGLHHYDDQHLTPHVGILQHTVSPLCVF